MHHDIIKTLGAQIRSENRYSFQNNLFSKRKAPKHKPEIFRMLNFCEKIILGIIFCLNKVC
jgi:hypothetical protein